MKDVCSWCRMDETGICAYHELYPQQLAKNKDTIPIPKSKKASPFYYLYILELEGNKYYVGITARHNPMERITQHGGILGARWTSLHLPSKVLEIRPLGHISKPDAEKIENNETNKLMDVHGIHNVRGGFMVSSYPIFTRIYTPFTKKWWVQKLIYSVAWIIGLLLAFNLLTVNLL